MSDKPRERSWMPSTTKNENWNDALSAHSGTASVISSAAQASAVSGS